MPPAEGPGGGERRTVATAVDAHHHLWDPADGGHDWLDAPEHEPLRRPFDVDDLLRAAEAGVDGRPLAASVVVQVLCDLEETRRLLALAADAPLVAGVVGWVDLTLDVTAQLDELRAAPGGDRLVGVRHLVQDEPDPEWILRPDVLRGLCALAAEGLAFDLLVRAPQRAAAVRAASRVPGLRIVLDHAGKPDLRRGAARGGFEEWARQMGALAALDGASCKLSGLVTEADRDWSTAELEPAWQVLLEAFGPARLAFGSDWPVCLLAASWGRWAQAAAELASALSASEQDALFGGAARDAYALTPAALAAPSSLETT